MIDKHGVFIGLVNTPIGKEVDINKRIVDIFKDNRNRITHHLNDIEKDNLFNPEFYAIFGSYDLAVISKVDDFMFGYHKFNPNTEYNPVPTLQQDTNTVVDSLVDNTKKSNVISSFNYHIYNCTSSKKTGEYRYAYDDMFAAPNNTVEGHPLISITTFKIKSSLLIGSGVELIESIKLSIAQHINKYNNGKLPDGELPIKYLILETTSWHEITLILTGSCFVTLGNLVYYIREFISLQQVAVIEHSRTYFQNSFEESLLKSWTSENDCNHTNIFSTSNTYFGVKYAILEEDDDTVFEEWMKKYIKAESGKIDANARIYTIPTAHTKTKNNSKVGRFDVNYILFNDADIEPGLYNSSSDDNSSKSDENILVRMLNYYRANIKNLDTDTKESIRRTQTTPKIKFDPAIFDLSPEIREFTRASISKNLEKTLPITMAEIQDIEKYLTQLHVSKAARQRVLKVLSNYNDIVLDRQLYIYMIDMRLFIMNMKGYLKKELDLLKDPQSQTEAHVVMAKINGFARLFEHVYYNIIQHSLRTMDLSEFNLDFNGGIQQNLSMYNFVFGLFRNAINFYESDVNEHLLKRGDSILKNVPIYHSPSVAYLSNTSGIKSYEYCLQLNYFNIAQPVTFVITIFKEAFNYLFLRIKHDKTYRENTTGEIDSRKYTAMQRQISRYILGWNDKGAEKIRNQIKGDFRDIKSEKINLNVLYHLFKEYPKRGSLRLQQEVLGIIQNEPELDPDTLLNTYQYLQMIDEEMFHYILSDYNNYKYYYCKDEKLYSTWFWVHFFQEPDVYNTGGQISLRMFLKALFRLTMLYIIVNFKDDVDNGTNNLKEEREEKYRDLCFNIERHKPWFKKLKEFNEGLFDNHFNSAFAICKYMHNNKYLGGFFDLKEVPRYDLNLDENVYLDTNTKYDTYKYDCNNLFEMIFNRYIEPEIDEVYHKILSDDQYLTVNRNYQVKDNDTDESIIFTRTEPSDQNKFNATTDNTGQAIILFKYIRANFLGYLKALEPHLEQPIRREKDGRIIKESIIANKIQADPHGGFFVTGEMKKRYFLGNNYLFKILNNHTLKCKIEYFNEIKLDENE